MTRRKTSCRPKTALPDSRKADSTLRVLWVTPQFPDPQGSGGMLHEFELLRSVAPRHEITILTTEWGLRPEALRAVQELGVRVDVVPWTWRRYRHGPRNRPTKLLRLLLGAAPTLEVWRRAGQIEPLAEALAAEERARPVDIVQVILGDLAPVAVSARAPTALLLFDLYSRQTDLVEKNVHLTRAIRYRLQQRNARRWEARWYRRADALACVSPVDAATVSAMLDRAVDTIPTPIPDEYFTPRQNQRSATTVTLVGSFAWEPNVDSVEWMCAEIWPAILRRRPDARLCVVGRFASPELQRTVEAVGGEFHVDVDDIRPYYWEAAAVIAPVRIGSGTRNKVLHAMACGAPLVATASAIEGIPAVSGDHLLVAADAAGLARAVVAVLDDPAAAAARAEAAREIAAHYSAGEAGAALEAWWEAAAATRPAGPPPVATATGSPPTGSVVVCTRERPELLRRSLASISATATGARGTDVVVVEQGEPSAGKILADLGVTATLVSDDGVGASRARNIGLRHARGDVVLFTDDDCEVPADWVRRHLEAFNDAEVIASFGPVTGIRYDERHDPVALPARHRRGRPPWVIGHSSNMAVRRTTLLAVGGFDERMGPGTIRSVAGEDSDLIVRLLRTGAVLVSGTGEPVRHIDWRSAADRRTNLISYEHGAGAWIGKALREDPRGSFRFVRARLGLLRRYAEHVKATGAAAVPVSALAGAFLRGLTSGIRMKPWRGLRDAEAESPSPSPRSTAV